MRAGQDAADEATAPQPAAGSHRPNDDTRRRQGRRALSARPRGPELPNSKRSSTPRTNGSASRSGIERRHFAAEGQTTSDLATRAARAALADAGHAGRRYRRDHRGHLDRRPDLSRPPPPWCRRNLGMTRGFAFDVQAVCAGFVYALANANALILSGQAKRVLVIGAETFSRLMDWTDRGTCVLFGDGAGALVLEAADGHWHHRRPRHPVDRPAFRRPLQGSALCRWRHLDRHHRPSADARQGSVPPCR